MTRTPRPSVAQLHLLGIVAWAGRDLGAAERLFRAVLARRPRHADALHHLGLVAQATGRLRLAERLLEDACRIRPQEATYAFNLGNLRFQQGRHVDALREWERSAALDPSDEDAWRNIGATCAEDGMPARAEAAFHRALSINPDAADVCRKMSGVLRHAGRPGEGRELALRARALERDPDSRARFAESRAALGRTDEALSALARATRLRPSDALLHYRMAALLLDAGREREARRACRRALALSPSNPDIGFLADSLEGRTPASPPPICIEDLFDHYAGTFDAQLVDRLGYRGPAVVWRAVRRVRRAQQRACTGLDVLDAGCGTGLAAGLLRPAANRLVGIDVSAGMLAKARARHAYDRLVRGDLVRHLCRCRARYDLIFAADVMIYVGDLDRTMKAARRALRPGGLLALSVELCDGSSYRLTATRRYAHSTAYVRRLAAANDLIVREARTASLRHERAVPVRCGVIVLERRPPSAS